MTIEAANPSFRVTMTTENGAVHQRDVRAADAGLAVCLECGKLRTEMMVMGPIVTVHAEPAPSEPA